MRMADTGPREDLRLFCLPEGNAAASRRPYGLLRFVIGLAAAMLSISHLIAKAAPEKPAALELLGRAGHVLIVRHAHAPGVGDPAGMKLGDCATQRNLDERGRKQARRLGEQLRAAGLSDVRVYTSQWCRCRETARLLDIGPVEDLPALNSFFERPGTRDAVVKALRDFLDKLPRDGRPVVLVTHQVNVTALTGHFPASGEGLILKLHDGGGFERIAEFTQKE